MFPSELNISTLEELVEQHNKNPINWGQLSKYRSKGDFAIFGLLDKFFGKTTGEKAYRAIHGSVFCPCGQITPFHNWKSGLAKFCSHKCSTKYTDWTAATKKAQDTMQSRHGGVGLASSATKKKAQDTNLKRYGSITPAGSALIRNKIASTMIARHGVATPYKNTEIAKRGGEAKKHRTWLKNAEHVSSEFEYLDERPLEANGERLWMHIQCGTRIIHDWGKKQRPPICRVCTPQIKGTSKYEDEIVEFIGTKFTIERNKRFYFTKTRYHELDIYLPELNLGIEFNGLFWHSEQSGKDRYYHKNKLDFFRTKNVRVISIFEHEWVLKKDICCSMLNHALGLTTQKIFARNCSITDVSQSDAKQFLQENHIAGHATSTRQVGLVHNNELVCIATFKRNRFGKDKSSYEMIRFCAQRNLSVVGGLSRLIKHFEKMTGAAIKTYCDLRWGTGRSYAKAGFTLIKETEPGYWYFEGLNVYHRSVFQKRRLMQITGVNGTEKELATLAGLNLFWDCGHLLFQKA